MILHHGTRSVEICQLHVDNIVLDTDVPYLNISEESDKQHLKNQNSKRMVLVHRAVLRDGLFQNSF